MPILTPFSADIAASLDTVNNGPTCEVLRSEVFAEQVQTYLSAVRTYRDTLVSKVNEYEVRAPIVEVDCVQTEVAVRAHGKPVL